jgi:very-short-patch-repair endonuclease
MSNENENGSPPFKEEYPQGEVVKNEKGHKTEVVKNEKGHKTEVVKNEKESNLELNHEKHQIKVVKIEHQHNLFSESKTKLPPNYVKKLNNLPHLKTYRKKLRNNLTPAEAKFWTYVKNSQLEGRKFRRQHSIDNYIMDFYCPSEKLAVELDGQGHFDTIQAENDKEKDLFLQACGIKVLRFENRLIFEQPNRVLEEVKNNFRKPSH